MTTYYTVHDSPIGPLLVTSDRTCLTGIYMGDHRHGPAVGSGWQRSVDAQPLGIACRQLDAYFAGALIVFDLPMRAVGTQFQQRVWNELARIRHGETISYGELARRIGSPNASRAVGLANGRNPLSIVVPCHRVVGAGGALTGYGGGLWRKEALLAFERSVAAGNADRFAWPTPESRPGARHAESGQLALTVDEG